MSLTGIFYCENANTHKIELIGNDSDFREVLLEFSENISKAPNEIPQFLTNFKNSKSPDEKISFSATKKYPSISSYALSDKIKREAKGKLLPNNNLKCYISEGSYIIDLHLIDD